MELFSHTYCCFWFYVAITTVIKRVAYIQHLEYILWQNIFLCTSWENIIKGFIHSYHCDMSPGESLHVAEMQKRWVMTNMDNTKALYIKNLTIKISTIPIPMFNSNLWDDILPHYWMIFTFYLNQLITKKLCKKICTTKILTCNYYIITYSNWLYTDGVIFF